MAGLGWWLAQALVMTLALALTFNPRPVVARTVQALPERVVLENFPVYAQWHNLSCEYASTRMMTAFWKREISEADFINTIGFDPNPHIGFRGNIDEWFGGTWHYGIYAEPIARMLETRGFRTKLLAGGTEVIKQELALGRPVQVWVIAGMGWSSPFTEEYKGVPFRLAAREHSVVIYGYDPWGVYIADPAYGGRAYYYWETFSRSWSYLDNMALSFWPADQPAQLPEPNQGVAQQFYRHWLVNGNIRQFGLPLGPAHFMGDKLVQYFERTRLEFDPKKDYTQTIEIGLLGRELSAHRLHEDAFQPVPPSGDPSALYFEPTKHTLNQGFRHYWETYGGLPAFGYPISEEFYEGGKIVQYFERARLEYLPENPDPYKVMLGLLGMERLR